MSRKIAGVPLFEDIEIYPLEASAKGTNACYVDTCLVVGYRPSYASCLAKVEARKEGRLPTAQADCSTAIGRCECPAQAMRKQEVEAGQAIFFINRRKLNDVVRLREGLTQEVLADALEHIKTKLPNKASPKPAAPARHFLDEANGGYEHAINAAMHKTATPPAAPAAPSTPMKAGMSLLEMARAQLAAKSQPTA